MKTILLVCCWTILGQGGRPDLSGRVAGRDGKPVAGAHVFIASAAPREGVGVLCPSCYPDCAKRALTAPDGAFRIEGLDPALTFRVLAIAEGHRAASIAKVDPLAGPFDLVLEAIDPATIDPRKQLEGRVVGPDGRPVAGALVEPKMFDTEAHRGFSPGIFDPVAVTGLDGRFALRASSVIRGADIQVEGRNLAPRIFRDLRPGRMPTLALATGATVRGRVVQGGQPVGGVVVGLKQASQSADTFLGARQVATDPSGRFAFENVAPNDSYAVYGLMGSLGDRGAIAARELPVGDDNSEVEAGDLAIEPARRLAGRVVLSDGRPIPEGSRLLLSREEAWDTLAAPLDPQGRFSLSGLPPERFSLTVGVRGYKLSARNESVDPLNGFRLVGYVDEDIDDLTILLEPDGR